MKTLLPWHSIHLSFLSVLVFLCWCWVLVQVFLTLLRRRDWRREQEKKDCEDPVSAWEPEGSCRDSEETERGQGNQRGDHAVRKKSSGKDKSGRFCPHLYPESVLCRIWFGVGGLCSTMGASSDKVRGWWSGSGQGPCRSGVSFSPLMGLETEFYLIWSSWD